jgi:hypothetical protein
MTGRKNVMGESRCIGVGLLNTQIRFMVEQTIQNVSCIANRHVDDFGVKGCVLIGNRVLGSNGRQQSRNATEDQNLVKKTRFDSVRIVMRNPARAPRQALHRCRLSLASLPLQQVPGYSCDRLARRESLRKYK